MFTSSLFNTVIPRIIALNSDLYHTLPFNHNSVDTKEHYDEDGMNVLTKDNWKRILSVRTKVYIPITCANIHHKVIEKYGHDRVLELIFINSSTMVNGQTQLTFQTIPGTPIRDLYNSVACRVEGLDDYALKIYVDKSDEERKRDIMRFKMIKWRESVHNTSDSILKNEIKSGNITKKHSEYLRTRVRKLIATTSNEYESFQKITYKICELGKEYSNIIMDLDENTTE